MDHVEFNEQLITQLTRIADSLEKMSNQEDAPIDNTVLVRPDDMTDEQYENWVKRHELDVWMGSFTEEQRDHVNSHIKTMILCNFAHEMEPLSPAIARLIREYV